MPLDASHFPSSRFRLSFHYHAGKYCTAYNIGSRLGRDVSTAEGTYTSSQFTYHTKQRARESPGLTRMRNPSDSTCEHAGSFKIYISWIPGARLDLSDIQWRLYRASLSQLIVALCLFSIPSQLLQSRPENPSQCHFSSIQHAFRIIYAILFLVGLHGAFAIHVLAACALHYACTKATLKLRTICPLVAWAVPSAVWLLARLHDGIPFRSIMPALEFLDGYSGPVRWQISFNLLALRMISWSMDCHWSWLWHKGLIPSKGEPLLSALPCICSSIV